MNMLETQQDSQPTVNDEKVKASDVFVRCLENEGVEYIFGIPGEENIDLIDALIDSPIQFVTTRHEQGAAFIADVLGRLTGRAGVCLSTLGPGATNLMTGVADANMDHAPLIAIAGQGSTDRMHKESHQILDLVNLFDPISKYATQLIVPEIIPEVVRKAFKIAEAEKPGVSFIDFPENVAAAYLPKSAVPLKKQSASAPAAPQHKCEQAANLIAEAKTPIIMAGNGVIRGHASAALVAFAEKLNIPVTTTFMAKGVIPSRHRLSIGAIGLAAHDYVSFGVDEADLIICIGVDMIEYHPHLWNPKCDRRILHIDVNSAEVDQHYILEAGVVGDISSSLIRVMNYAQEPSVDTKIHKLHDIVHEQYNEFKDDVGFPIKPQKIISDIRQVLDDEDIIISDVGA
ncbi:MAG: acetolactate synthase-1/2/3 large subunit, partial [Cellvibrionaceae bacterium]